VSTLLEIETALKELPLQDAEAIGRWLQKYLDQQAVTKVASPPRAQVSLPDYATRRRMILGDKVLPNMVVLGREQERW
jgi:hypothetical protein